MDPNAALVNIRAMMSDGDSADVLLIEAWNALDEWLMKGGFLPKDWADAQEADKAALKVALNRPRYTEYDGPKYGG